MRVAEGARPRGAAMRRSLAEPRERMGAARGRSNGTCKWHTGHPVVRCPVCGVAARGHKSGAHEGPHVSLFQPLRWTNSVMPQPSWARQSSRERRQARRRLPIPFRRSQARRECKQKGPLHVQFSNEGPLWEKKAVLL